MWCKMFEAWKEQFSYRQLSLVHDRPITFVISQWQKEQKPNIKYLVYRWAVALTFFVSLVFSLVDTKHPNASASYRARWLIYLTNWGYTMCNIQALLAALMLTVCVSATYLKSYQRLQENILKLYKFYWLTNTIATDLAFGITSLYWSLIYDEKTMALDSLNFLVHANNSILMMIDLFVVSHPMRLLHCCYPVVFGISYAVFSVIFYTAGGISREGHRYIYTILNWENPGKATLVCFAVIILVLCVHLFTWGLHKLRIFIHSKCSKTVIRDDSRSSPRTDNGVHLIYVNEGLVGDNLV